MRSSWRANSPAAFAVLAAAAALSVPACSGSGGSSGRVGEVKVGDLTVSVTLAGMIVPRRKTVITPPYAGYVRRLFVKVGDRVKRGDPVIALSQTLDGPDDGVFPIRASFPGTVVQVLKAEGEYTESGADKPLVRIDETDTLFVEGNVPEIELHKLKLGQEVLVKASSMPGRSFKGAIRQIFLAAKEQRDWDRTNVEFPIRIEIQDKDPDLRPGMSALVDVIAAKKTQVLVLRQEFVRKSGDSYSVTLESGEARPVQVGLQNEESFEIVSGLKEGDRVRQVDFLGLVSEGPGTSRGRGRRGH